MYAYLKTEGKLDYRECQIDYYTYCMVNTPHKYNVNVNVHIQTLNVKCKKTLNMNTSFDDEKEAIDYGIIQGKNYIDQTYDAGKIKILKIQPTADNIPGKKTIANRTQTKDRK